MPYSRSPQNWRRKRFRPNRPDHPSEKKTDFHPVFTTLKKIIRGLKNLFLFLFFKTFSLIKAARKRNIKYALQLTIVAGIIVFLLGGIIGVAALAYYSKDLPEPDKLIDRSVAQSTKIYDRTGENLLYEIHGDQNRTIIRLEDLPDQTVNALIALGDKNFYQHSGFSYKRIALAVFKRLYTSSGPGASTLTQQLVKNAILSPERKISRKLKEWILTFQIERKFSKEQILQLYFNEIPYGSTAYGVESAAQLYFKKSAKNLTLAESASLAAMVKAPTYYSPYGNNRDKLLERKDLVLKLMEDQGYITEKDRLAAQEQEIDFKPKIEQIQAPHFVIYVKQQLTEMYNEKLVEQGGLKVITTLDYDLQKKAEEAVASGIKKIEEYDGGNAALLALDPTTGEVLAMVGSRDYFDEERDGNVNVTLSLRQPGSSFKPVVYAAAFKKGFTPETILYDVVTTFKTGIKPYTPHNYDLKENGPVTIRKALAGSLNIPAVKTIYLTGIDNVLNLAEDLTYTSFGDRSRFGLSLVLGGGEVRLIEHVAGFGAFANDGVQHKTRTILKVEDKNGKILEEFKDEDKRVLDKEVARQINSILSDNLSRAYAFGEFNNLTLGKRPVAAKTGTTNDYRDAWTIGYTPSLAAGVWAGNNDNSEMRRGAAGGTIAAPIWNAFMRSALEGRDLENFSPPPANSSDKPVLRGENTSETRVDVCTLTGKLATIYTPPTYTEHRIYKEVHNILHYVSKNNPQGPAPADPANADIEYANWEEAVQIWIENNKEEFLKLIQPDPDQPIDPDVVIILNESPPAEEDDDHRPELQPQIRITSPENNQLFNDNLISVSVDAEAPGGVGRLEYYIDDFLYYSDLTFPFGETSFDITDVPNGFHRLKVIAYDPIDNFKEDQIQFQLQAPKPALTISWAEPANSLSLTAENFPLTLTVALSQMDNVQKVNFYAKENRGQLINISADENLENNQASIVWEEPPGPGTYKLQAEALTLTETVPGAGLIVIIQ